MDQFDGHPGTAKLAQVLDRRTSQKTESPLTLDFGEIQANGSLKTNTFPVPIPKGDYTCLLYTSDAADDLLCVEFGGRRIIKKKKKQYNSLMSVRK